MKTYTCFIISPIGRRGTDRFTLYERVYGIILEGALKRFSNIRYSRGDHHISDPKIDESVNRNIDQADFCICDLSEPNPNVYYELGRADAAGKPVILIKQEGTPDTPVDIKTRRFYEYDIDSTDSVRYAQQYIEDTIRLWLDEGTLAADPKASARRRSIPAPESPEAAGEPLPLRATADDAFSFYTDRLQAAVKSGSIPLAEEALRGLEPLTNKNNFLHDVAEKAARIGSADARQLLRDHAADYLNGDAPAPDKMSYFNALVYCCADDRLIPSLIEQLEQFSIQLTPLLSQCDEAAADLFHSAAGQMYLTMYTDTRDEKWFILAESILKAAVNPLRHSASQYMLALCYQKKHLISRRYHFKEFLFQKTSFQRKARKTIDANLEAAGENATADELALAAELYIYFSPPDCLRLLMRLSQMDYPRALRIALRMVGAVFLAAFLLLAFGYVLTAIFEPESLPELHEKLHKLLWEGSPSP